MQNKALLCAALVALSLTGCDDSAAPLALSPATAQTAPSPTILEPGTRGIQPLTLGGHVEGRPGETFDLSLEVDDGTVDGNAVLSGPGGALTPYEVEGQTGADREAVLTLYPYDADALTDSLEVTGALHPGGALDLRESGASSTYGRVALSDSQGTVGKVWNHNGDGGEEVYELTFTSSAPREILFGMKLTFNSGGTFYRRGPFEVTRNSGSFGLLSNVNDYTAQANFYVFDPTLVRIDLYGWETNRNGVDVRRSVGKLYFRTNSNSFFSGGLTGSSVPLLGDSFLVAKEGNIFSNASATLKLVSGGS